MLLSYPSDFNNNIIFTNNFSHPVNIQLQQLYNNLEAQRQALLNSVSSLSHDSLTKRPQPNKWSISEVLTHLESSERLSIQYLNKKILGIEQYKNTNARHELLMLLVITSQRLPLKFRAPKVVLANTPSYTTWQQLIVRWDKTRSELKTLLEKFSDDQLRKQVYRHPRVGMINIQQALIFFREHVIHHQPQIKRLLKRL